MRSVDFGHSDSIYVPHVLMLSWTPEPHYQRMVQGKVEVLLIRCYHLQFASLWCSKYCNKIWMDRSCYFFTNMQKLSCNGVTISNFQAYGVQNIATRYEWIAHVIFLQTCKSWVATERCTKCKEKKEKSACEQYRVVGSIWTTHLRYSKHSKKYRWIAFVIFYLSCKNLRRNENL
jgi:hypothetical protein